jgi:DNA-binding beta-propeller fold protein YncE
LGRRLLATIDGVAKPCAMVATATEVWVTGNSPSVLARIDPSTDTIEMQTPLDGSPCGISLGPDGRLWVALLQVGRVVAVDPATAEVTATVDGLGGQLWDLKAGFGAIWVVDRSKRELVRIDPATAAVVSRTPIGRSGSGLAIAADAIWVVDDVDSTVLKVDPTTNAVTATSELRRGSSWFVNDDRTLLVANRLDGSITPIDPSSGAPGIPIGGSRSPLDGTVGGERAYVPDGRAGTLVEVDLRTLTIATVDRLEGARNPFVAEIAFGDVWVLDYGGQRIWRMSP